MCVCVGGGGGGASLVLKKEREGPTVASLPGCYHLRSSTKDVGDTDSGIT